MSEPRIGRVVAASLHQALADHMPLRLEFYENWLKPMRMREGRIGAASFNAVLSFLSRDGDAWDPVMTRAGNYAAEWTFASLPWTYRTFGPKLPERWRRREAFRLAGQLVRETISGSRGQALRNGDAQVFQVERSAFCETREPTRAPRCGFYAAALERLCHLLGIGLHAHVTHCHAMGAPDCLIALEPDREAVLEPDAAGTMGIAR